jgi:hypothetical protein
MIADIILDQPDIKQLSVIIEDDKIKVVSSVVAVE